MGATPQRFAVHVIELSERPSAVSTGGVKTGATCEVISMV